MTISGRVSFVHPEGDVPLVPGDVLLVRPSRHKSWFVPARDPGDAARCPGRWEVIWFIFQAKSHMLTWMQYPDTRTGYIRLQLRDRERARWVLDSLKRAHHLLTSHHAGREDLALNALEEALICCHYDQKGGPRRVDERVETALRFLHGNLSRPVCIAEVAEAAGLSRAQLLALFKRQTGVPMMTYLEQERMRRAKQLLAEATFSVKQVAADVGYEDARYFAKRFRRATGLRPTVWRQANGIGRVE